MCLHVQLSLPTVVLCHLSSTECDILVLSCCIQLRYVSSEGLVELYHIALNTLPVNDQHLSRLISSLRTALAASAIDPASAKHLLVTATRLCAARKLQWCIGPLLQCIANLPALRQLSVHHIRRLMEDIEHLDQVEAFAEEILDCISTARDAYPRNIETVFKAAIPAAIIHVWEVQWQRPWEWVYVDAVCRRLPLDRQLGPDAWLILFELYQAAMNGLSKSAIWSPVFDRLTQDSRFQAARAAMPAKAVNQLLSLAVDISRKPNVAQSVITGCLHAILKMPAASNLAKDDAEKLLEAAAKAKAWGLVCWILRSSVGNSVSNNVKSSVVTQMFCSALDQKDSTRYIARMMLSDEPMLQHLDFEQGLSKHNIWGTFAGREAATAFVYSALKRKAEAVRRLDAAQGPPGEQSQQPQVQTALQTLPLVVQSGPLEQSSADAELTSVIALVAKLDPYLCLTSTKHEADDIFLSLSVAGAYKVLKDTLKVTDGSHHDALLQVLKDLRFSWGLLTVTFVLCFPITLPLALAITGLLCGIVFSIIWVPIVAVRVTQGSL